MRTYDLETRAKFIQLFRNAIKAFQKELVSTPFEVGNIAQILRLIAVDAEPTEAGEEQAGFDFYDGCHDSNLSKAFKLDAMLMNKVFEWDEINPPKEPSESEAA